MSVAHIWSLIWLGQFYHIEFHPLPLTKDGVPPETEWQWKRCPTQRSLHCSVCKGALAQVACLWCSFRRLPSFAWFHRLLFGLPNWPLLIIQTAPNEKFASCYHLSWSHKQKETTPHTLPLQTYCPKSSLSYPGDENMPVWSGKGFVPLSRRPLSPSLGSRWMAIVYHSSLPVWM